MNQSLIFKKVHEAAVKLAVPVFVVGGYVRDKFIGKSGDAKDIDFVVVGDGVAFGREFDRVMAGQGRLVEFPEFGTARYVWPMSRIKGSLVKGSLAGENAVMDNQSHDGVTNSSVDPSADSSVDTSVDPSADSSVDTSVDPSADSSADTLDIEFASARAEKYDTASRKPSVTAATLEEDLSRRDFTVNAMAREVKKSGPSKVLIDPFHGADDLKAKILRTPLDPDITFSDDPLRMLRAARFAAELGFTVEPETLKAMSKQRARLKIVSAERQQDEFMKLLAAPAPSVGLWLLYNTGLINEFIPEVSALAGMEDVYGYQHKDNLSHTFKVVDNIALLASSPLLRFAGLLHDIAKPQTKKFVPGRGWTFDMHEHLGRKMARVIGRRLRVPRDDIEYMAKLIRWHLYPIAIMDEGVTDAPVRRLVVNLGDDLRDLLVLCRADITTGNPAKKAHRLKNYDKLEERVAEVLEKDRLRAFQSPVRGEEIMEVCGLKPGPTVGRIKDAIEEAILDGVIPNEHEPAREYFIKIKDEYTAGAADWEKAQTVK